MTRKTFLFGIAFISGLVLITLAIRTCVVPSAVETDPPTEMRLPPVGTPGEKVCERHVDWTLAELQSRIGNDAYSISRYDHDCLAVIFRSNAPNVMLSGGIQSSMNRFPDSDIWTLCVQIEDLQKAVIGFEFLPDFSEITPETEITRTQWRGNLAPPQPPIAESLLGVIREHEIDSNHLNSPRRISVYMPPNTNGEDPLLIYMADGQLVEAFACAIEPQVNSGTLPPVFICGIHCAGREDRISKDDDPRAAEYLETLANKRFYSHEQFLFDDVVPWMESEICNLAFTASRRIVFGVSNGGAWAMSMGLRNPQDFEIVIAFSSGVGNWPIASNAAQRFFLLAGELEGGFAQGIDSWAEDMQRTDSQVILKSVVGGHDRVIWQENLPSAIKALLR